MAEKDLCWENKTENPRRKYKIKKRKEEKRGKMDFEALFVQADPKSKGRHKLIKANEKLRS